MASKTSYQYIFIPILAVLLLLTVGFGAVYTAGVLRTSPGVGAGAAQIADTASPAEQYNAVTTEAALAPGEEPVPQPQGQPQNQPTGSPATAAGDYPTTNAR